MTLFLKRLWIQISSDRRRFGALCVVVAMGLLLWARLIVIANIPKQAVADGPLAAPAPAAPSSGPLQSDPAPISLDGAPRRDPFVISTVHFPKPAASTHLVPDAGKSAAEAAEELHQARARMRAQLRTLVEEFTLEAVMTGVPQMAVISGRTYRLEEQVPAMGRSDLAFRLVEVRPRAVVLAFEEHRFVLTMTAPGSNR